VAGFSRHLHHLIRSALHTHKVICKFAWNTNCCIISLKTASSSPMDLNLQWSALYDCQVLLQYVINGSQLDIIYKCPSFMVGHLLQFPQLLVSFEGPCDKGDIMLFLCLS
jgi:hypothetical protein